MKANDHITVCVCTYKRPEYLKNLLERVQSLKTDDLFSYSVVVVDNDPDRSAWCIVEKTKKNSVLRIKYISETVRNIASARNRAIENATGNYIAFIDDDEFPKGHWLVNLYKTCIDTRADGVIGPVRPYYEAKPPDWIIKGNFFERASYRTGTILKWNQTLSGNSFFAKQIFRNNNCFNPVFGIQGEDRDFFQRMIEKSYIFVWCNEALVYERIPVSRLSEGYFVKRAFLQGNVSAAYGTNTVNGRSKLYSFLRSALAAVLYTLLLPFMLLAGRHIFMKFLLKDIYHVSSILALSGIYVLRRRII